MDARDKYFMVTWALCIALLYAVGGLYGAKLLFQYKEQTESIRHARLATGKTPEAASGDMVVPSTGKAEKVLVGIIVNRIGPFDLKESAWVCDFRIWFRRSGNKAMPDNEFRIVNGEILAKEMIKSVKVGNVHHEEYHVVARIQTSLDPSRFPLGDNALLIDMYDLKRPLEELQYISDAKHSHVLPEALPVAVKLLQSITATRIKTHQSDGLTRHQSHFIFAMLVASNSTSIYFKLFQGLFASVAIAFITLFIAPNQLDARFGIPVGAFFASIGNNLAIADLLPQANRLTLTDMINLVGWVTIFLVILQSAVSLYIYDTLEKPRVARLFDHVSFMVLSAGYIVLNLLLPLTAKSI